MATRKSSRPAPGHPSGNAENILSSGVLLHDCIQSRGLAHKMNPYCAESFSTTIEVENLCSRCTHSQMNNAPTDSDGNRLGTIVGSQLFHNVLDVDLDRLF